MRSQWSGLKPAAIELRKAGLSYRDIESRLGIPRSTLSGWLKNVPVDVTKLTRLQRNKQAGWEKARANAAISHRQAKIRRIELARRQAQEVLNTTPLSQGVLDIAFAMLYFGEGSKGGSSSIANSNPKILKFVLFILENNYKISRSNVRCELHLRADQSPEEMKKYWARELNVPLTAFRYVAVDNRSKGKATYAHYKGVCVIYCGVAVQRKLICLYEQICDKVSELETPSSLGA